jgi:sugar phosphate isomerase/epimerase
MVSSSAIEVLHLNDYPANLPNTAITDADRIYPGDGIAPVQRVLQILQDPVKPLVISVEVFNKEYYKRDALEVAKTAFSKTKKLAEGV